MRWRHYTCNQMYHHRFTQHITRHAHLKKETSVMPVKIGKKKKGKWNTSMTKHQHCWNEDVNKGTQRMLVPCTSWWQQCGRVGSFERVNTNTINGALFFFVCVGFGPPQQWMVRCLPHRKHYNIAIPCNEEKKKKKRWLNAPILSTLRKYDHASQLTLMSNA